MTRYTNHEQYQNPPGTINNDIAILELAEEVDLATYTPACLAKTSDTTTFDGKTALVYGEILSQSHVPLLSTVPRLGNSVPGRRLA